MPSASIVTIAWEERILGSSDFVKEVLAEQKEQFERRYELKAQGYDIDRVVAKAAEVFGIEPAEIWKPGNQPLRVKARSLVCYRAVRELGISGTSVGKQIGLCQPAVSRATLFFCTILHHNILRSVHPEIPLFPPS